MPPDREDRKSAQLLRGSACLCCRKRKIRCNGERPYCAPCVQHGRLDECIYDDSKKKSRTQLLREKVAQLERKLAELEAPLDAVATATSLLQNQSQSPSSPANSSSSYASSPAIPLIDSSRSSSRDGGALDVGAADATAMGKGSSSLRLPGLTMPTTSDTRTRDRFMGEALDTILAQFRQITPEVTLELSLDTQRYLLSVFMHHRSQCYFYTDLTRFQFYHLQRPGDQPHPSLINAINLLGCFFSKNPQFRIYETDLLKISSREIVASLQDSEHVLDLIQASSLLALYLFFNGRFVEGYRHAFCASRLAMGIDLHQIKFPDEKYFENYVEYWDRVVLFWQVYLVDRSWSTAVHGVVSAFSHDEYHNQITSPMMWGSDTLQLADPFMVPNYLTHLMDYTLIDSTLDTMAMSLPALQAFVITLYDRTFHSLTEEQATRSKPIVLMGIQRLQHILPTFLGREMWRPHAPYVDGELMITHTILRVLELNACLNEEMEVLARVHNNGGDGGSEDLVLVSETENQTNLKMLWIVDWLTRSLEQVNDDDYHFMDLLFPRIWRKAAELLIRKVRQLRALIPMPSLPLATPLTIPTLPIPIPTTNSVVGLSSSTSSSSNNSYSMNLNLNPDMDIQNITPTTSHVHGVGVGGNGIVHSGGSLNQDQISSTIMFVDNCVDSLYRTLRSFNNVTRVAGDFLEKLEQEYIPLGYTVPLNPLDINTNTVVIPLS